MYESTPSDAVIAGVVPCYERGKSSASMGSTSSGGLARELVHMQGRQPRVACARCVVPSTFMAIHAGSDGIVQVVADEARGLIGPGMIDHAASATLDSRPSGLDLFHNGSQLASVGFGDGGFDVRQRLVVLPAGSDRPLEPAHTPSVVSVRVTARVYERGPGREKSSPLQ